MILYPAGHAKNKSSNLQSLLKHKCKVFGGLAIASEEDLKS